MDDESRMVKSGSPLVYCFACLAIVRDRISSSQPRVEGGELSEGAGFQNSGVGLGHSGTLASACVLCLSFKSWCPEFTYVVIWNLSEGE